ncbi:MAG: bacteriocin immunity protein [Streptococcus orisratti]|nr:bacteriocin immunity protein [Streptococcus orisratti]
MTNKDIKILKIQVMTDCYNLLLNPDIFSEERHLLLTFKSEVEAGGDFSRKSYELVCDLQRLSLKFLQDKKGLSAPVREFYESLNTFQTTELRNNEIAKGLIASSGLWL